MKNQTSEPCVFIVGKAPDTKTRWLPTDKCVICQRFFPVQKVQCETCHLYAHCRCVLEASRIYYIQDASQDHTRPAVVAMHDAATQTDSDQAGRHVVIDMEDGENEPAEQTPPPPVEPVERQPSVVKPANLPEPEPQNSANLPEPELQNSAPAAEVLELPQIAEQPSDQSFEFWKNRFTMFSRFDNGIMVDKDSFQNVCPEVLARHISTKCSNYKLVLDPFCGTGSNAIQLALAGHKVIAVDTDPKNIAMAKINAKVYGVADRIVFKAGDSSKMFLKIKVDAVVTTPLWGKQSDEIKVNSFLLYARDISTRVSLTVHKDFDNDGLLKFAEFIGFKRIKLENYSIAGQGGEFRTFYMVHDTDIRCPGFGLTPVPMVKNDVQLKALPMSDNQRFFYWKTSTFASYEKYVKTVEEHLYQNHYII